MNACHTPLIPADDFSRLVNCLSQFPVQTQKFLIEQLPGLYNLVDSQDGHREARIHHANIQASSSEDRALTQHRKQFRVAIDVVVGWEATETAFIKEVVAPSENAAIAFAVHLLLKKYDASSLVKVVRSAIEEIREDKRAASVC